MLVAGGDSFTDRGVYDTVVRRGKGVDYPFDGGTARVTGHGCCDPVFNDNVVPRYVLTGDKGVVRRLFKDAELAIANHEMPVTDAWGFHSSGLRFSGKPELTEIFTRAGIDWMSLANNHIKDYDTEGISDSRRILRRYGIASGGAGVDLEQARRISYLEVGKAGGSSAATLAIIPCVGVVPFSWAGPDVSGGTPCLDRYLVPDIKEAGRKADVVLVYPHWGVEYTRQPMPSQRKHAARWVKAGADLVLGGHSHVAGAIEDIDGVPVLYSLGNLIFDQHWSTNTMESMLVEATFHGRHARQPGAGARTSSTTRRSPTSSTRPPVRASRSGSRSGPPRPTGSTGRDRRGRPGDRLRQADLAGRRPEREVEAGHEARELLEVGGVGVDEGLHAGWPRARSAARSWG